EALRDSTVVLLLEVHSISLQVGDSLGRSLGDDLDGSGVGEAIGLLDRVGGVLGPAVLGVHRGQRRVDAAGGQRGLCLFLQTFAGGDDVGAGHGNLDRGTQARSAGVYDQHRGGA